MVYLQVVWLSFVRRGTPQFDSTLSKVDQSHDHRTIPIQESTGFDWTSGDAQAGPWRGYDGELEERNC